MYPRLHYTKVSATIRTFPEKNGKPLALGKPPLPSPKIVLVSSSLEGSLAKRFLREGFAKSLQNISRNLRKYALSRQERVRKFCGKCEKISRNFFLQRPFPEQTHQLGLQHTQESPDPRAPKPPKSLETVSLGLPARSVKQVLKKSPNTDVDKLLNLFRVLGDFFRHPFDTPLVAPSTG